MDFTGITYRGRHSSEFGIVRVSNGSRYQESLLPTSEDSTTNIPGGDGDYYFGSSYRPKVFNLNFAFDNISELQLRQIRNWLSNRNYKGEDELSDLIFDETPYKRYVAKVTGEPQVNYICFNSWNESTQREDRVYKGEGTVSLTSYFPFAFNNYYKSLNEFSGINNLLNPNIITKSAERDGNNFLFKGSKSSNGNMIPVQAISPTALFSTIYPGETYWKNTLPEKSIHFRYYETRIGDGPTLSYNSFLFGLALQKGKYTGADGTGSVLFSGNIIKLSKDSMYYLPKASEKQLKERIVHIIPKSNLTSDKDITLTADEEVDIVNLELEENETFRLLIYTGQYTDENGEKQLPSFELSDFIISENQITFKNNFKEWADSSFMLYNLSDYDKYNSTTKTINLYNAGDLEADWILTFDKPAGTFNKRTFSLDNKSFSISAISSNGSSRLSVSNIENEIANSAGKIEIDTGKNMVTFIKEDGKRIPAYFLIKEGALFKIPSSLYNNNLVMNISGGVLENVEIKYNYLYY